MTIQTIEDFIAKQKVDRAKARWRTQLAKPPQGAFDDEKSVFWTLETNHGPIRIRLMPEVAPMHVSSTAYLTKMGFYDGLAFHRVIPGFMAQGGCPEGTGTGGPGYNYDGEFSSEIKHDRGGLLSMANAGPRTDGSQFFLTFTATPWLDGKHTIFGEVVEGLDVLKTFESKGSSSGQPSEDLRIDRASISVA